MRGKLTTIAPDGATRVVLYGAPVKLDALQSAVGGHIESIPYFSKYDGAPCVAFCNEEGKLEGLPVNATATALWHAQGFKADVLCGSVCIVQGDSAFMREL